MSRWVDGAERRRTTDGEGDAALPHPPPSYVEGAYRTS